jgi:hypothetical protein
LFVHVEKSSHLCIKDAKKGHKRLKLAAQPWGDIFLVHEKVLHGVGAKTRKKGIGFKLL